jgi:hypothetical protein
MDILKLKTISVKKALVQKLGGKWKHEYGGTWRCDDNIRYVCRVATGMDYSGEYDGSSRFCLYYVDGRTPEWLYFI